MRIIKAKDYAEMSRRAAQVIAAQVIIKPDCVLGLATGSTPIGLYENLIEKHKNDGLDFSQVRSVNLDEYYGLSPRHPQSYYYFMHDNLFNYINMPEENINLPSGIGADGEAECRRYDKLVEDLGGIDLQLLGLGHNGHIGFNEPGDEFVAETHCVSLTESTIEANKRFFESIDDVPKSAITIGMGAIIRARAILLVVSGSEKAGILKQALCGSITPNVPASLLQLHGNVIVVADEAALSCMQGIE